MELIPGLESRFFDLSIDMLCVANFHGYFHALNPAWERTLGFSREELLSRPMVEFVHPADRERTAAQHMRVKAGNPALCFENRYLSKSGGYRWLLWNATADLQHQLIYSVARDMTEQKEGEQKRAQLTLALNSAQTELKLLEGILPICMYCRKIRDDTNYWQSVETYLSRHTDTQFSHGICPTCYEAVQLPSVEP